MPTVPARAHLCAPRLMLLLAVLLPAGLGCWQPEAPFPPPPPPKPALGINLTGPADWNSEVPFADVFRFSRAWLSQKPGAPFGGGPPLELDERGWIKRLEPGCFAETPLVTDSKGWTPGGVYTVHWTGQGKVRISEGEVVSESRSGMQVRMPAGRGGFFLQIRETEPSDPVRDIQVLLPGVTLESLAANPWNPTFLERWQGVACLRFMDFMLTNNSKQRTWADRPVVEDATFTVKGIPVELLCDLANRLEADAWFCLPHLADDDYVRQFAAVVRDRLDPKRKAYLEYSNEVWNPMFDQHQHSVQEGTRLGLSRNQGQAGLRYTAQRSLEIFAIFEQVLGGHDRLVRVLAAQDANPNTGREILGWQDAARKADALAIAPYIGMSIPEKGEGLTAAEVSTWTVDRFFDEVEAQALPKVLDWMAQNQALAKSRGLRLVAYEGGQHFVGVQGGENNEALTKLLMAANRHPRIGKLYDRFYAGWEAAGGDLLCHFASVAGWDKWGCWGLLEHTGQDIQAAPKYLATMAWARGLGQHVGPLPAVAEPGPAAAGPAPAAAPRP